MTRSLKPLPDYMCRRFSLDRARQRYQFGLGASVFGTDIEQYQRIARRIDSGMVYINSIAVTLPELPFRGVKKSG
ncbi:hypothetical protein DL95DRAFT_492244 [Leptodontidium sp. 2 PMI_412]|nr:hypothetical protein DL95DRAFT_492244 [Leptodontidium sp. 2 PMI_412]